VRVWKSVIVKHYANPLNRLANVWLPKDAKILRFGAQGTSVVVWYETSAGDHDPYPSLVDFRPHRFYAFTTGEPQNPINLTYRETVLFEGGSFVLHLYEDPRASGEQEAHIDRHGS